MPDPDPSVQHRDQGASIGGDPEPVQVEERGCPGPWNRLRWPGWLPSAGVERHEDGPALLRRVRSSNGRRRCHQGGSATIHQAARMICPAPIVRAGQRTSDASSILGVEQVDLAIAIELEQPAPIRGEGVVTRDGEGGVAAGSARPTSPPALMRLCSRAPCVTGLSSIATACRARSRERAVFDSAMAVVPRRAARASTAAASARVAESAPASPEDRPACRRQGRLPGAPRPLSAPLRVAGCAVPGGRAPASGGVGSRRGPTTP